MSDAVASDGNAHNKYGKRGSLNIKKKKKKYIKSNINIIPIATWRLLIFCVCVFFRFYTSILLLCLGFLR